MSLLTNSQVVEFFKKNGVNIEFSDRQCIDKNSRERYSWNPDQYEVLQAYLHNADEIKADNKISCLFIEDRLLFMIDEKVIKTFGKTESAVTNFSYIVKLLLSDDFGSNCPSNVHAAIYADWLIHNRK